MYSSRNIILLIGLTLAICKFDWVQLDLFEILFLVLLSCTVKADTVDDEQQHLIANTDEDNSISNEVDDELEFYRRASLRPVALYQRASLRPFAGKRASLRPFAGKRASLRPFAGKRASLRPVNYMGKRKRRSLMYDDFE